MAHAGVRSETSDDSQATAGVPSLTTKMHIRGTNQ
jgi:hypothetical protein